MARNAAHSDRRRLKPPEPELLPCALCDRSFGRGQLTKHHCLPRQRGGTQEHVELICSQCHGMVHVTYTNTTLAALYPTIDQLKQAPELAPFLRWVRKQPPSRRTRNAPRRRKL
jgi:5-methylcytosine-specific restriction enzyme A